MNRISTRRRLVAVLLLPFLMVLAGCGKLHADFDVKDVDTINASFDIAIDEEFAAGSWASAEEFCSDAEGETVGDDAPTVEPYEENGQFGCKISGVINSEDYDETLNLTEADGEYHFVLSGGDEELDFSQMQDYGLEIDFRMTFTFPGEIIQSSGGEVDGNSVTFTDINDLAKGIDIRAEAGSAFPWVIVLVIALVLGLLLLLALAAIAFFVIRSRRKKNAAASASMPGGYGAAAAMPGAAPVASQGSPQGQQWGQASPPPAAPQEPQWGQASPPPAAPPSAPQEPQWGQPSPPPAAPPSAPQEPQWGQPSPPPAAPPSAPQEPQWGQPSPPPAAPPQDGQQWGRPDQGQQPPQNPGW